MKLFNETSINYPHELIIYIDSKYKVDDIEIQENKDYVKTEL